MVYRQIVFGWICLLFIVSGVQSQGIDDLRKGVYGAKRQVMREVNKTKRDVRQVNQLMSSKKRGVDPETDTTDYIRWSKSPYIPNSGMIRDYQHIYSFLHASQEVVFTKDKDLKSIQWDSVNNQYYKNVGEGERLLDGVEVMGWHPYWMGDSYKYYPYKMISILSLYAFDINANTGDASNQEVIDTMMVSGVLDSAKKYGTKAFISVTSFGKRNNKRFLSDQQSREIFMTEILRLLNKRKDVFAGIDLDFEGIDSSDASKFTQFVKELSARLSNVGYRVILNVPYYNDDEVFNYAELVNHVQYFNIMGYDFNGEQSLQPGAISPLASLDNSPNLTTAVNDLLLTGVPSKKIILSLPLYGAVWETNRFENGGTANFESFRPYYKVKTEFGSEYNPFYDALSQSMFFLTDDEKGRRICWFENEVSLDLKFAWTKEKGLKGIGLWALGYDQNDPGIWKAITHNFGAELVAIEPIETSLSGPFGLAKQIAENKALIGLSFLVFTGFIILGFSLSLMDHRVRDVLFKQQSFRFIYSTIFILFAILGVQWWWNRDAKWELVIGLVIGALGVAIVNLVFSKYRRQLR